MKCYNHSDREAVATCKFCGKALCKECADTYNEPMCDECARQYIESTFAAEKRYLIVHSLIGIALAAAGVYLIGNAWGLLAFFMAFGWIKRDAEDPETTDFSGTSRSQAQRVRRPYPDTGCRRHNHGHSECHNSI